MKPTKYAAINYKRLLPFIQGMNETDAHRRYDAPGYMPLVVEALGYTDHHGNPVYSLAHYGKQNGDLMRDPDMEISVDMTAGEVEPLTIRNDYMGTFREVYKRNPAGQLVYNPRLRADLDAFLWHWLRNIHNQGFAP